MAISINGGTINTSGGGVLVATNNGNNFLYDATLNGVIQQSPEELSGWVAVG